MHENVEAFLSTTNSMYAKMASKIIGDQQEGTEMRSVKPTVFAEYLHICTKMWSVHTNTRTSIHTHSHRHTYRTYFDRVGDVLSTFTQMLSLCDVKVVYNALDFFAKSMRCVRFKNYFAHYFVACFSCSSQSTCFTDHSARRNEITNCSPEHVCQLFESTVSSP